MRKNPSLIPLVFTLIAGATLGAQTPQPQTAVQPPPKTPAQPPQPPPPGTTYKPEFDIPRSDGSGQSKGDPAADAPAEGYVIGPQDDLSIIVSDEADLTGKFRVDSDGTISMPYLGRVPVSGLSLAEAQDKVTALLKKD